MEEDSGDIGREQLSSELSAKQLSELYAKQEEAIALLYKDLKMDKFLSYLAHKFRLGHDKEDLRQDLAMKIVREGDDLLLVRNLRAWLSTAATNICRNDYRHMKKVNRHREKCMGENVRGRMRGGAVNLLHHPGKTPEQEAQLKEMLCDVFESLPHDVKEVASMWVEGKSPAEIAKAINRSEKTVYRHHKAFQKALVKRCLAESDAPNEKQLREVVDVLSQLATAA